jgi:hypothetical protein
VKTYLATYLHPCTCVYMFVCECVREGEGERKGGRGGGREGGREREKCVGLESRVCVFVCVR